MQIDPNELRKTVGMLEKIGVGQYNPTQKAKPETLMTKVKRLFRRKKKGSFDTVRTKDTEFQLRRSLSPEDIARLRDKQR